MFRPLKSIPSGKIRWNSSLLPLLHKPNKHNQEEEEKEEEDGKEEDEGERKRRGWKGKRFAEVEAVLQSAKTVMFVI